MFWFEKLVAFGLGQFLIGLQVQGFADSAKQAG